ncbi:S46 family peptidase [Flavihumibacter rivuli]|uniref:S46 family peptidase n=1 Tax=Flavihumibacter rivuli TaxID=2838156 RepID=UPI001BDEFCEC|nr:S46 family peptidase [Flavihumibacter rivuli]ULQ55316.1 S46 family peptidase [Flavihumibacter rivuli]
MKRILAAIVLSFTLLRSYADEGMWLPLLLGKQVYADMVKRGLKLSADQLYSMNKASIKDAIVIFGRGCTGEIVSGSGLIFTNHHCGYDAIASASSVEHNYLKDGFYAKSFQEEIPSHGLSVQFLLKIEDVTKEVEAELGNLKGAERAKKQSEVIASINARFSDPAKSIEARISPLFKSNQFLVFVYQRYNDVRLVGTPPESIGKYGGDTDNWEWPRHTGDFSVFRVYADKDGNPANYSTTNLPLKPKHFLPVSIKGVKDGDYAMIFGYPGSTNRYETSYGVKLKTDIENPSLVGLRDIRLKYMLEEMKKDPAVKLKLASDFAGIANYWKFFDGESKQLLKYKVADQKAKEEAAFIKWAQDKPEYKDIFSDWEKAYASWRPYAKHRMYINEGVMGSPLAAFAASLMNIERLAATPNTKAEDLKKALDDAEERRKAFLEAENKESDVRILATTAQMFYNDIDKNQHPIGFYENLKGNYGDLKDDATYRKWATDVFKGTAIFNDAKWEAFKKNPATIQEDPAFAYASAFLKNWNSKYMPFFQQFNTQNNELARLYLKGIMQMNPGKKMYPDATFTMRVSYGNVKSYQPRDAVKYDYVCTMKGVLEKYKPGDYEFDLPKGLLELAAKKDYGQYIDKQRNDLVVSFITTNDITGGNSGSPVLDANGNLIGLAFDGNYEALSHKIAFDKDLNRTICVDVRYVLWCIDKLGGASNLIRELKLVR